MKRKILYVLFLIFCVSVYSYAKKLNIVATTTNIASIVKEIAQDKAEVLEIVPSDMCPGHFDLSPKDAQKILNSDIFFYHGWEQWIKNLMKETKSYKIPIEGNFMIPQINLAVAEKILEILSEIDPQNKEVYKNNYDKYSEKIKKIEQRIKKDFQKYKDIKVICSEHQKEFLEWLGFSVVYSYPRQEQISLKDIANVLNIKENINLVVDNLQSGPNIGRQLAKELNAKHIVLTNFVEGSYIETLLKNISKIKKALK